MRKHWGPVVVGAIVLAGSSAQAAENDRVSYAGARVHVEAAAIVSFRALARAERHSPIREEAEPEEAPEPEEKAEPNVHFTVPSPLVSPLSVTSISAVASPYVSASFLAQPDLPAVGTTKNETPPDTNGAVGRDCWCR